MDDHVPYGGGEAVRWDSPAAMSELEKRIADNPGDAEAHLRLAYIYEHYRRDDGRAKHHYLRHYVLSLGYPDAESALAGLGEAAANDGGNANLARIHIGTIRAYRNEFDEALVSMRAGTVWRAVESPNYRIDVVPGSTAERDIRSIVEERERGMREILDLFSLDRPPAEPIVYYLYESRIHKALLTGNQMPAHALTKRGEVHAVHGPESGPMGLHEDVHIVLRRFGRPPKLLEEGAAMYADRRHGSRLLCDETSLRAAPGILPSLMSDRAFSDGENHQPYAAAVSFVEFLIETRGVERFKDLYGSWGRDIDAEMRRCYGTGLETIEADWLRRIRGTANRAR